MVNFYLILPLLQSFFCVILIAVVLTTDFRSGVNRLFSFFLAGLAVWGGIIFSMRSSPDLQHAYNWETWLAPIGVVNAVVLFNFAVRYTFKEIKKFWIPLLYTVCFVFLISAPTGIALKGMQLKPYGYAPIFGPAGFFMILLSISVTFATIVILVRSYRSTEEAEYRNRIAYVAVGIVFMFVGGMFDILPQFGLPIYPGLILGNLVFCILTTVAIAKHNLLDIRVVLRRSLAYFMTSAIIALPFIVIFYIATTVFLELQFNLLALVVFLMLLALVLPPIWRWAQRRVDRWFYGSRYDFVKSLESLFVNVQSLKEYDRLAVNMSDLIAGAMRASSVYLFMPVSETGDFACTASAGEKKNAFSTTFKSRGAILRWLQRSDDVVTDKDMEAIPQLLSISPAEKAELERVKARLIVPMKTRSGLLVGLLVLGPKTSGFPYYIEDEQLLLAFSNHMATHLDNLRLYDETRQSERALRNSEEKLRLIFDSLAEGIIIADAGWVITQVNHAAIQMHECLSQQDFIGRSLFELIAEKDRSGAAENLKRVVNDEDIRNIECTLVKKNKIEFPAELSAATLRDVSNAITGFVIVTDDVTERVQMEATRREFERKSHIASRLATVGEMAAGIAHEINNPLTGVVGFSQLLLKKNLPEDIRKDASIIYDGSQRVASIVSRLLTFARQQKPERRLTNINDILSTTLELRTYQMQANNIKVVTEFPPDLPATVADPGQLQQVFLNLIMNAETEMRLAHGRGNLLVKTEGVNGIIRISFIDDGPGIPEENMKRLFEPFFTTREVGQGTGLGLSICHGIVSEHGGKIYAKSTFGAGATFIVDLPIVADKKTEQIKTTTAAGAARKEPGVKILIVDDEPMVQHFLNRVLTDEGYGVESVGDAGDALIKLKDNTYHAIILDIKLPGMSGIELFKHVQNEIQSMEKKVVFVTGDVMGEDTQDFLAKTHVPYLTKPFSSEQLKKTLSHIIAQSP